MRTIRCFMGQSGSRFRDSKTRNLPQYVTIFQPYGMIYSSPFFMLNMSEEKGEGKGRGGEEKGWVARRVPCVS